jgi:hypothetical protein
VKILGLPLELLNNKFLWDLGNYLGKTVMVDPSYKYSVQRSVERVLVIIYLSKWIEKSIYV